MAMCVIDWFVTARPCFRFQPPVLLAYWYFPCIFFVTNWASCGRFVNATHVWCAHIGMPACLMRIIGNLHVHNKTLEAVATPCSIYMRRQTATGYQHHCKYIGVLTRKVCCQIEHMIVWRLLCFAWLGYCIFFRFVACIHNRHFSPNILYCVIVFEKISNFTLFFLCI